MAAHSQHGMSGQSIIFACPGSVNMNAGKDPDDSGDTTASILGTAIHEAGEFGFLTDSKGSDLVGMVFNGKRIAATYIDAIDTYVNKLREYDSSPTMRSFVEQRMCISSIDKELLWGTGDYIGFDLPNRKLVSADYKNGYVSVEIDSDQFVYVRNQTITGNVQTIGYALGALDKFFLWDKIDEVETCIIQPNKPHSDGPIRSFTYTMPEMLVWWQLYKETHELSLRPDAPRYAGNHCKYCKSRGTCTTRLDYILGKIKIDTAVDHADPDQLIALFGEVDSIVSALKKVKEEVLLLARKGHIVPNQKLIKGYKRAVLKDEEALIKEAKQLGFTNEQLFKMELKAKTAMGEAVGKEFVNKHFQKPEAGLRLVPLSEPGAPQRPDKSDKPTAVGIFKPVQR